MNFRYFIWLLCFASATLAGGFIFWLLTIVTLDIYYSDKPPPHWIVPLFVYLSINFGALTGAGVAYFVRERLFQFSLRDILIVATILAPILAATAYLHDMRQ